MSDDHTRSKTKEKKAQRDAERKNKKRKILTVDETSKVEAQSIIPRSSNAGQVIEDDGTSEKKQAKAVSKKRKQNDLDEDGPAATAAALEQKKSRKSQPIMEAASDRTNTANTSAGEEPAKGAASATKSRFILFVGNLPYSTTDVALNLHFAKLFPLTLRHRTDPKTKKSKGFAFLEFENYDRMKTCLSQYHHSMFDPESRELGGSGKGSGRGGRKINVELTAGGGGKTEGRKEKIRVKNERLEGQRERRAEAERKEQIRKERKEGLKAGKSQEGGDEGTNSSKDAAQDSGIHPSRLARLNG